MISSAPPVEADRLPGPPTFTRSARLIPTVPQGEVEAPLPPTAPTPPQVSLISLALPVVFCVVFIGVMIVYAQTQDSGGGFGHVMITILSIGFMALSSVPAIVSYYLDKRKFQRQLLEREDGYHRRLEQFRQEMQARRHQQAVAMQQLDPDIEECLSRVERRDQRLWERSPEDQDFLTLRLGVGSQPFATRVLLPRLDPSAEPDPLVMEARALQGDLDSVTDVPIGLPLGRSGLAGLMGDRRATVLMARALALQIATHHSPDEVKIVAVYPAAEADQWEWLRWLPHVWSEDRSRRYLAHDRDSARTLFESLAETLGRREEAARNRQDRDGAHRPVLVCFLADQNLLADQHAVARLVNAGPNLGFFSIFVSEAPRRCSVYVELTPGQGTLVFTENGQRFPFRPDYLPPERTERLARAMAPLRLDRRFDDQRTVENVPASIDLFDLLEINRVEQFDALMHWRINEPHRAIRAPMGKLRGSQTLVINLQEGSVGGHGSHAMLGGTTGSGKTQLLKAFIALLAAHYHPHDLSFLLIDYKGGSLLSGLEELPHVTGRLTNLEQQDRQAETVERLFTCIGAELLRRRNLLGGMDINAFHAATPNRRELNIPHLIVVIDEFAQLITQNPNSTALRARLGEIAQQGRSLGVHLLLATQDPGDAVEEKIANNVSLRVCLRMGSPSASRGILGSDLAHGTIGLRESGRGYYRVDVSHQPEPFQAPFADAPYRPGSSSSGNELEVLEVSIDGSRRAPVERSRTERFEWGGTQLKALSTHLRDLADQEGIEPLPELLLQPLPDSVTLDGPSRFEGWGGRGWQPTQRWLEAKVGLVDNPMEQSQAWLSLNLAAGHLAVYGAPQTGKTTFVQTMVTSLVQSYTPDDVWLYLLDFGGTLRKPFVGLPHVGAVIAHDEEDRLNRLLRYLQREVETRRTRFAEVGAQTLPGYRAMAAYAVQPMPAIVVIVDNYARLSTAYPDAVDSLASISQQGVGYGIHLVLTANSPTLNFRLSANIVQTVAFRLADPGEYTITVGRTAGREPASVHGRAFVKANPPMDVQIALPAGGQTDEERAAALEELARRMSRVWSGRRARSIPQIPEIVTLSDLLSPRSGSVVLPAAGTTAVPVGLDLDEAEPLSIDLEDGPHFVVTGTVAGGKTTLLQSWLLALAERNSPRNLELYLVDLRSEDLAPLEALPHCQGLIADADTLDSVVSALADEVRERRLARVQRQSEHGSNGSNGHETRPADQSTIVLAIDGFDELTGQILEDTKATLEELIRRRDVGLGFHIVLAARAGDLTSCYDGWVRALLDRPTGCWIGPTGYGDLQMFNTTAPASDPSRMAAAGEGYFVRRGRLRRLKAATPHAVNLTLRAWVDRLAKESDLAGSR